jgi:murein biosynthesis integral membrane protein MurJ
MKKYRFLFTGGGTGGHVYPNIAIYEALKEKYPDAEFLYVGTRRGSEATIVPSLPQPMEFVHVPARGLPQRLKSLKTVPAVAAILRGTLRSLFILHRFRPDLVIGSGGYASAPVLLAAALLKKDVFIHEQNAVPGRLNLFVARFATRIGVAFPSTAAFFQADKVIDAGYPLRRSIRQRAGESGPLSEGLKGPPGGDRVDARMDGLKGREKFGIPADSRVLFICSGSMGARTINRAAAEAIPRLLRLPNLFIILSTGKAYGKAYRAFDDTVRLLEQTGCPPQIEGRLLVREYFDQIAEVYGLSDLVVSRAGAGSIQEITAMGLPAILVPKIDLPADHQVLNAREIEKVGGGRVLYEEVRLRGGRSEIFLDPDALCRAVEELLSSPERLAAMRRNLLAVDRPDSTAIILDALEGIIEKKGPAAAREIPVYYLQAVGEEKNLELPFPATTVGSDHLADVPLAGEGAGVRFAIRIVQGEAFPAMLRVQRGRVLLNDREIAGWAPLRPDDRITCAGRAYIFKSSQEVSRENVIAAAAPDAGRSRSFLWALATRLADFGRAVAAAALFGAGRAVDVFAGVLAIAGFLRRLVGTNAAGRAFLPVFVRLFQRGPRRRTWEAASSLTLYTALLSLLLAAAGVALAPLLVGWLLPGFRSAGLAPAAAGMARILFPVIFLGALAALMTVHLRAFNRRRVADLSSLLFALAATAGAVLLLPACGMNALPWGVLLGCLAQMLFLLPFLLKALRLPGVEFAFRPSWRTNAQVTRKYAAQLAPAGLGAALAQAPPLVERAVASALGAGAISALYFAMEVFRLPFSLASRSIRRASLRGLPGGTAMLDRERAGKLLVEGVRINLFLLAPLSILMIALANPLVSLLLQRSHFGAQAVARTALALQFFAIGLCGWGVRALTARILAERLEARADLALDLLLLAFQIPLAVWLARTPLGFAGVALATSVAYTLSAVARVALLQARLRREGAPATGGEMAATAGKTLSASLLMVIAIIEAKFVFNRIQFDSRTLQDIMLCVSLTFMGTAVYLLSSLLLKNTGILIFKRRSTDAGRPTPVSLLPPSRFLETVAVDPDFFRSEYRYKINLYLSSPSWEVRNVGIKLIGLFKERGKAPYLVELLAAGRGNGFMRRNAVAALRALNPWSAEIEELMLRLLKDRYFEVRAAAMEYLGQNIGEDEFATLRPVVHRRLERGSSEERIACLRLIARKGGLDDLPRLQRLYLDSNSLVREELLELLYSFYRRELLDGEAIKRQVQQVLVTSNHLTPEFRIKSIINRIYREVDRT